MSVIKIRIVKVKYYMRIKFKVVFVFTITLCNVNRTIHSVGVKICGFSNIALVPQKDWIVDGVPYNVNVSQSNVMTYNLIVVTNIKVRHTHIHSSFEKVTLLEVCWKGWFMLVGWCWVTLVNRVFLYRCHDVLEFGKEKMFKLWC